MADQCIVCLEDLGVVPDDIHDDLREVAASSCKLLPADHPGEIDDEQKIALIKPCGHVLHDECLREWSQKANSCPICRNTFNVVEVLNKVGGEFPVARFRSLAVSALPANSFLLCFRISYSVGASLLLSNPSAGPKPLAWGHLKRTLYF